MLGWATILAITRPNFHPTHPPLSICALLETHDMLVPFCQPCDVLLKTLNTLCAKSEGPFVKDFTCGIPNGADPPLPLGTDHK